MFITEPERKIPIKDAADLVVIGGSCTGVFAAIRAARLGLRVILVEKHNILGGVAVTGLVNVWHSLHDIYGKEQIIAGLTHETLELLKLRGALKKSDDPTLAYSFNPWELALILDQYVAETKIKVMLHTSYTAAISNDGRIDAVIIENSEGRFAVRASFFIDASGDGRVAKDIGVQSYAYEKIQPPTSCFYLKGSTTGIDIGSLLRKHGAEFGLEDDWGWNIELPNVPDITMRADNHVFGKRLDIADDLTFAEIEGRRKADAFARLLRAYSGRNESYPIVAMCSHIGTRETVHYVTRHKADVNSLLLGKRYESPILRGTYRVDIHHSDELGITFKYLDGREEIFLGKDREKIFGNWRKSDGLDGECARYYELPFDSLIVDGYDNFIPVGRMINADEGAFGALRVMVNLNQLGEAAGVAAYLCVNGGKTTSTVAASDVCSLLRRGGSAL